MGKTSSLPGRVTSLSGGLRTRTAQPKHRIAKHHLTPASHCVRSTSLPTATKNKPRSRPRNSRMCQTHYYKSRQCGHSWYGSTTPISHATKLTSSRLELTRPCGRDMNLVTCPDFGTVQPFGPAEKPRRCRWAPRGECPRCDYDEYDRRKRKLIVIKRYGWRFGLGPGKDSLGVDLFTHRAGGGSSLDRFGSCGVM